MFVCAAFLLARKQVLEHFDMSATTEIDILQVYEKVLQRQPSSSEMADAIRMIRGNEITIEQLQGRLMDSDEYQRLIKLQSNTLTPELEKIIHDKQQLAFISNIYLAERTANIPNALLMPLKDVYIYLEYNETAFRMMLGNAKYEEFENKLLAEFQLSKEKTLAIFDKLFSKADLLKAARDANKPVISPLNDPPPLARAFDSASDANPSGNVTQAVVATNTATNTQVVVPVAPATQAATTRESFVNYANEVQPLGVTAQERIARTIYDKDSDSSRALFDIEQRSKEVFDIHKVASAFDGIPDAFVYVPTVPVRFEKPATHHERKPVGNTDPFAIDLFGCLKGAPI